MTSGKFSLGLVMAGVLVGLGAASAQASDIGKTREQVKAELRQALARGEVLVSEVDYPPMPVLKSIKSREQARAEVRQATAAGDTLVSEVDYPPTPVASGPSRSRAEVVAEMMTAKRNGSLYINEVQYPDNRDVRPNIVTAKSKSKVDTANASSAVLPSTTQN